MTRRRDVLIGSVLALGGAMELRSESSVAAGFPIGAADNRVPVDLIATGNFATFAGVEPGPTGLTIGNLGRVIVNQDGTGGAADPPWCLAGTHLRISGGFTMAVGLADIRGEAAVLLAGRPPIVYDEFLNNRGSLRVSISGSTVRAVLVSATSGQRPAERRTWTITGATTHHLEVRFTGAPDTGSLGLSLDGRVLGSIPAHGVFAAREVWLGLDAASPAGSFRVSTWQATPAPGATVGMIDTSTLHPGDQPGAGLQELATVRRSGFRIGAALTASSLYSDPAFARLALGGQIGQMTTENALKFQFVHPQPTTYEFREADALVATARANGLAVHGHTLIFGEANPPWLRTLAATRPDLMRATMLDHITTVVAHYAGTVRSWDVVNEAIADPDEPPTPDGLRANIWRRTIGAGYIADAFRAARAADPDARLFINDYGLEANGDQWLTMRALLRSLLDAGVPIDGVGLQCHVYEHGDEIHTDDLTAVLDDIAAMGLTARISELDVYGDNRTHQANQFGTVLRTAIAHPACESLTFWGLSERYGSTSFLNASGQLVIGDGLPWDAQLRPLSAVAKMQQVLTG